MNKNLSFLLSLGLLCFAFATHAEIIGHYHVRGVSAQNVSIYRMSHEKIYAVSCTASYAELNGSLEDVDKLAIHVNPGEVTDRHGRHGASPDYDFGVPVGTASFYAQPDAGGNIDFSIVNTLPQAFEVLCSINLQN